ncbi:MAG: helix-turn-helix domain-containing protein, partial [Cyanobacteria bacterium J06626_6]
MPRSYCVHPDHKQSVVLAMQRNRFLTQGALAGHLEIALSTVNNFFRGLNVSVAKFEQICEALTLDPGSLINPADPVSEALAAEPLTSNFYAYDPDWVGRESLIESLLTQINKACRLLIITGIAGVGKTALVELLTLRWTDNNPQFRLIRANFDCQEPSDSWDSTSAQLLEDCGLRVSPEERSDA